MLMKEALVILDQNKNKKSKGFMVSFEVKEGSLLRSDYFPDKHAGEDLINSEEEAWAFAYWFANASEPEYVNILVIDSTFSPVKGYSEKMFKKY